MIAELALAIALASPAPAATVSPSSLVPVADAFPMALPTVAVIDVEPAVPKHTFFMKRWHANDWANIVLYGISTIDTHQTSGKNGFLAGPPICDSRGTCSQPYEADRFAKPCVGPSNGALFKGAVCGGILIFGLKGTLIEGLFGKHWSNADRNFDAAGTLAGSAIYFSATVIHNSDVQYRQNGCASPTTFFDPFTGKCQ